MALHRKRPAGGPATAPRDVSQHFDEWRTAARRVAETWRSWLDADQTERDTAYSAYTAALAAEERAAGRLEREAGL